MRTAFHITRQLATVAGATLALVLWHGSASAANLQIAMSVVNITVSASAYDPATAQATVTVSGGIVAQVKANKKWSLQMRATSATFVFTPLSGPSVAKPVSDLQLRDSTVGSLFVPTLFFATIDTGGSSQGQWVDSTFDLIFRANALDDPAGRYSVTLEFQVI